MTWKELIDRCELFADARKSTFDALLKEAEKELAIHCDVYEDEHVLTWPYDANTNFTILPTNYKNMVAVYIDGDLMKQMDETELDLTGGNELRSGKPTAYYIMNNFIYFNTKPGSGSQLYMVYNSTLEENVDHPLIVPIAGIDDMTPASTTVNLDRLGQQTEVISAKGTIELETTLDFDITGMTATVRIPGITGYSTIGDIYYYGDDIKYPSGGDVAKNATPKPIKKFYTTVGYSTTTPINGWDLRIENYQKGPVIPTQYHRFLCDYAIALASVKASPEMFGRHMELWEQNIVRINELSSDRELVHSIKSVI